MNNLSQDAWFFTHQDAKEGPVDFVTLQSMAQQGKIHPRQDLIWSKGMESWLPAGEIQGLFVRRTPLSPPLEINESPSLEIPVRAMAELPVEQIAPEVSLPEASPSRTLEPDGPAEWQSSGESLPGASRLKYLFVMIVFPLLWLLVLAVVSTFLKPEMGEKVLTSIASAALALPGLVFIYITLMRLVNLGMSRWWILAHFVPLLNVWVGYRCFACPGGYAVRKKLDGAGIFLAIVYGLFVLAGVVGAVLFVGILAGMIGTPHMHEQLLDRMDEFQKSILPK